MLCERLHLLDCLMRIIQGLYIKQFKQTKCTNIQPDRQTDIKLYKEDFPCFDNYALIEKQTMTAIECR
ncbi:hypothetical protein T11_14087 [Trichinella zimbabwensis]|uniref:Uncharacterized protein n=1 Tax=Trichinella zimbabwensis TaxID=268475 RepID=A0A0V1GU08_9BILA|nr:hypothetical protein T11_14087 [Trichinella zimbabwensis]